MKNLTFFTVFVLALALSCKSEKSVVNSNVKKEYPKLDFDDNQGIILFDRAPTNEMRENLLRQIFPNLTLDLVEIRECKACDTYMELWTGNEIGTGIHARAVAAGSGHSTDAVGDNYKAQLSVNIKSTLPPDFSKPITNADTLYSKATIQQTSRNKKVVVAVIDTGIDLAVTFKNKTHLWHNPYISKGNKDKNCYFRGEHGWNFVDDDDNIQDDNIIGENKIYHGTRVSQLIVSQITNTSINDIEIMTLKTHDQNGQGDLFDNICAIHYAIDHKANIINASWGFYSFDWSFEDSYFYKLLTEKLKKKRILFVTAAGNQLEDVQPSSPEIDSRDLEQFKFVPAVFANRKNNILVATTHYDDEVSSFQNFSSKYVDYAVLSNYPDFQFKPWRGANESDRISGSSYATAILAGKIAADIPVYAIQSRRSKRQIQFRIDPQLSTPLLLGRKVNKGLYIHSAIE